MSTWSNRLRVAGAALLFLAALIALPLVGSGPGDAADPGASTMRLLATQETTRLPVLVLGGLGLVLLVLSGIAERLER